jgi:uncharacterized membrane protein (UPF0127 family)
MSFLPKISYNFKFWVGISIGVIIFFIATIGAWYTATWQVTMPSESENRPWVQNKDIGLLLNFEQLEIAETQSELSQGLMGRRDLCQECGMLFIMPTEARHGFWMKDTYISLDMIFINSDWEVVTIHRRTQPRQKSPSYTATQPAKYVLEVNAGYAQEKDIEVGDKINPQSFPEEVR